MDGLIQSTQAIDALAVALTAPRKRPPADTVQLAALQAAHDAYLAHVRAVVADLYDDKAAAKLNSYADMIDDAHHDWFCDAVTAAQESESYEWWNDPDVIRDMKADRGRNEAKDAA